MDVEDLGIEGAWVFRPRRHTDERGTFLEQYTALSLAGVAGHALRVAQVNTSVSAAGVVRGVHYADVPPGQAKYVTCTSGAVLDVVVDLRVGSPTFGVSDAVRLDDADRRSVYLSEGLGHAFLALTDDANVTYLCSEPYNPGHEHGVHPLDPELDLPWPDVEHLLSDKDAAAPTLAKARAAGLLPDYAGCTAFYAGLRGGSGQ